MMKLIRASNRSCKRYNNKLSGIRSESPNKIKVAAIIVAAGKGKRLKGFKVEKPYINLAGKPILIHTLEKISNIKRVNSIILVVNHKNLRHAEGFVKRYKIKKVKSIILGGRERYNSVYKGLRYIDDADLVLIHDCARPLILDRDVNRCIGAAIRYGAAILASPVKETVKGINAKGFIKNTLNRDKIFLAQTPQVFNAKLIVNAYKNAVKMPGSIATDDATLVERLKRPVKIVIGSSANIKITTLHDLIVAENIIKKENKCV